LDLHSKSSKGAIKMEIKSIDKNKTLIEFNLYEIKCPYCNTLLQPDKRKRICKCKVVKYKLTDKPADNKNKKSYPILNDKQLEVECLDLGKYIEFEIIFYQKTVTLFYDVRVKPSSKKLRELLSLDFEDILSLLKMNISLKKEKKTLLYIDNLNFDQRINFLRLKNMRALENVFNKYLLSGYR